MTEKRYAIVRVDNKCPDQLEKIDLDYICRNISCYQGKECSKKFYGDTKEQLIRKVAQAILRSEVKSYKKYYGIEPMRIITRDVETQCLKIAKKIVKFLGVE